MSSNRLTYDKCAYAKEIQESTSPLDYYLYRGKYENSISCPVSDYTNILNFSDRTNMENELYGLNRPGTLCPSLKYNPYNNFNSVPFSPPLMCEGIHYITPNNLEKPKTNMLSDIKTNICK